MQKNLNYISRKIHRYLGISLAIQFLGWTLGGLYFSWNDLDDVHGGLERKHPHHIAIHLPLVSPQIILDSLHDNLAHKVEISKLQLVSILGTPHYQIHYQDFSKNEENILLCNAYNGKTRNPITEKEALLIAEESYNGLFKLKKIQYLESIDHHHEYRGKPLPAYAIEVEDDKNTIIYISKAMGTVQAFRNSKWRLFDFLWMLHTMDYDSRDDFGNGLLKIFSLLGIITILSGVSLFIVTSSWYRQKRRKIA